MDILKTATEWVKAELFSTPFFIVFGVMFMLISVGFWQLGKTVIAKSYIVPTLVAGVLLLVIGLGLFFTNKSRITEFQLAYNKDTSEFIKSEIVRTERTLKEYETIVFKVIPFIIIIASIDCFYKISSLESN